MVVNGMRPNIAMNIPIGSIEGECWWIEVRMLIEDCLKESAFRPNMENVWIRINQWNPDAW